VAHKRTMTSQERFFWTHSGLCISQGETKAQARRRCAEEMAQAEAYAQDHQWIWEWNIDDSGCIGCMCTSPNCPCSTGESHETLYCVLYDEHGEHLASLSGICGATKSYRRVIEAELAQEAMATVSA
jgi:hypothetical protein